MFAMMMGILILIAIMVGVKYLMTQSPIKQREDRLLELAVEEAAADLDREITTREQRLARVHERNEKLKMKDEESK